MIPMNQDRLFRKISSALAGRGFPLQEVELERMRQFLMQLVHATDRAAQNAIVAGTGLHVVSSRLQAGVMEREKLAG